MIKLLIIVNQKTKYNSNHLSIVNVESSYIDGENVSFTVQQAWSSTATELLPCSAETPGSILTKFVHPP